MKLGGGEWCEELLIGRISIVDLFSSGCLGGLFACHVALDEGR